MKELSEPPIERDQVCTQLNLLESAQMAADRFCEPLPFLPATIRLPIDMEKPSRSYRKVFIRNSNKQPLNTEPYDR